MYVHDGLQPAPTHVRSSRKPDRGEMSVMTSNKARWEAICDELRLRIVQGDLAPGDLVPPELELMTRYSASRDTIRRALNRLEREGLVTEGVRYEGRWVRAYDPIAWVQPSRGDRTRARGTDGWASAMTEQGYVPVQETTARRVEAPKRVAAMLRVKPGAPVVWCRQVRSVVHPADARTPVVITDAWVRESVARRAAGIDVSELSEDQDVVVDVDVVATLGHGQAYQDQEYRSRMPSHEEMELLELRAVTPVLECSVVAYDRRGRPLMAATHVCAGDRIHVRTRVEV